MLVESLTPTLEIKEANVAPGVKQRRAEVLMRY
jgi:hypothetical protein